MQLKTYMINQGTQGAQAPFTLDLSLQGIRLLYHLKGSPTVLGDVAFTDPRRHTQMSDLGAIAARHSKPPIDAMIVVPCEYVVFGSFASHDVAEVDVDTLISHLLKGTNLTSDDVVAVFQSHEATLFGAAVERRTLSEARQFVSRYGFEPIGFTTHPPRQIFPVCAVFNLATPLKLSE